MCFEFFPKCETACTSMLLMALSVVQLWHYFGGIPSPWDKGLHLFSRVFPKDFQFFEEL